MCSVGNVKISFKILKDTTKFLLAEPLLASLEEICSMALVIFGIWWYFVF